mmetsp:Transcript_14007/g.32571  ORF Transcript_14007/g.32571 Transcript_14007/m.32571 type:complete len:281 (-) Transcript_14007:1467-2309(-)|eukprot:CAMPEP_0197195906 /NCGR_PEP_ID=MMETSP1423-20130617/32067_1 /TAXON_ID=476441 /ORGANISM="Pseudo-nitzschia heimii, Strain UNC1101" /LENGTH=280 /DNA_ID=CAMNT_0042649669 /DNA_START=159 /DNA_END=1001 /DNA_ORIENTATION=+
MPLLYSQDRSSIGVLANIADHQERQYRSYIEQNNNMGTSLATRLAKGEQFEGLLGTDAAEECRDTLKGLVRDNVEKERQLKAYVRAIRVVIDDAGRALESSQREREEDEDKKPAAAAAASEPATCEFKEKMDAAYGRALEEIARDCVLITQEPTYLNLCRQLGDDQDEDDELAVVQTAASANQSDSKIKCPLTMAVMDDPVRSRVCKHSFQRAAIFEYLRRGKKRCPVPGCRNGSMTVEELEDDPETLLRVRRYRKRESAAKKARAQTALDMEEDDEYEF